MLERCAFVYTLERLVERTTAPKVYQVHFFEGVWTGTVCLVE
jgi:hypothetical protein